MLGRSMLRAAIGALAVIFMAGAAPAAEVKVLSSVALKAVLDELAPEFEKANGDKVTIGYGLAAEMKKRVLDGESTDVIIVTRPMIDDLDKQNRLAPGSVANVAGTPVSLAARAGAPKPDIASVDALKRTLLAAKSIAYADPAKGGVSGVVFARAVERLGIAEELKPKSILLSGTLAAEVVAKGEAELGVGQASEIVPVAGVQLVGPLPGELASTTLFTAAVGHDSKSAAAAQAFIAFLRAPAAAPKLKAKGFEPE